MIDDVTRDPSRPACEQGGYDDHDWQWIDGHRVCVDCALIDLAGERLLTNAAARLGIPKRALSRGLITPRRALT